MPSRPRLTATVRSASAWTPVTRSRRAKTSRPLCERIKAITGRIDLVHCNNSRDEFASGRDRHAGMESGTIDPALLVEVVRAAGATAICETPDPAADVRWLRAELS